MTMFSIAFCLALVTAEPPPPPAGVSITVYSSADPRGFDPQQFVAQQREGRDPTFAWQVPGFGVVRETRTVKLKKGTNALSFDDVAAFIDPTTVGFADLTDPKTSVLGQNFEFDLVSPSKLYERYLGREVRLVSHERPDQTVSGILLSANQGQFVLNAANGITVVPEAGTRVELLGELPGGLLTRPTLVWQVNAETEGEHTIRTTYQTAGMTWRADYNLVLDQTDTKAAITPWVTLLNVSGASYQNAQLRLVAGDVQKIVSPRPDRMMRRGAGVAAAPAEASFEEEQLLEYHLYTLTRPANVLRNSSQQLALFLPVSDVKVKKRLVYVGAPQYWGHQSSTAWTDELNNGNSNRKVGVFLELTNDEASGLGKPLPKGRVRVYKSASDGTLEFVGEDLIDHTPKNQAVSLKLGDAFDVTGERVQTAFRANNRGREVVESFTITLKNAKPAPQAVEVREYMYRWTNWAVTEKTHEFRKLDARSIAFDVTVPPEGSTTIGFTVKYSW
ncbi:MAG: DUF4139 domain-containing protein [Phycisphaerae bacterium]|jgi:hypothetical protein|nr:DUF4139 domain-containing protein [Phycisphaerae bacterium]